MTIRNIEDFAKFFGSESVDQLDHDVYKYTDCGAWIYWDEKSFTIGSIVEGSDAEFDETFEYPVESETVDAWLEELERLTDEAWHEANDEEEEEEYED